MTRPALCAHSRAVPVTTFDGTTVAALCPDCDRQLPAEWLTCDHHWGPDVVEVTALSDPRPVMLCLRCGVDLYDLN